MRKRTFATLTALLILSLVVVGCRPTPQPTSPPTEAPTVAPTQPPVVQPTQPPAEKAMKVGMVSDVGGIDDASFNQNTWEGLQRAQQELGVQAQFIESQAQADYEKNITEFAEQDYDLIITVGFLLGDATAKMAQQYPDINFAIVDYAYDPPIPNVAGIVFNTDEAAFPIGYLAAAWADMKDPADPQVGYVAGMKIPPVEIFIVAYENGVKYYNEKKGKNVQVKGVYVGDFEAPDQGKIQGNSLIDEGVDVIFGVGGKTGNGGLAAAKERGKWGIGVDVDQYYTLPNEKDILISSCMKRLDNAVYSVVEALLKGQFPGGSVYVGTLANGGVGMAPYHDFEDEIPDELKQEIEAIKQGIIDGTIKTGWPVSEEPTPTPAVEVKVGMVSDVGGIDDASFNQNTWEGLQRAQQELGVQAQFIESQAQADYEKNITEFAEQDYDLIITVGFLLGDATAKMAQQYPDINFAIVDYAYDPPIPNVAGIVFNTDEAAFPIGYLAAAWADMKDPADPQVGYVAGMKIPPVEIFIVAYENGVKYYNEKKGKNVQVKGVYVGDFEAPDQGKIQGNSLIDEGVDVIFGVGGKTGNGGLAAAKERGKWGIGVDVDQYYTLPNEKDILISSCMKRLDNAVYSVVEALLKGQFPGGSVYVGTLANGGVGMAPYHDFEDEIPDELKQEIEAIKQGIIDGTIKTGWPVEG
ncbi:MAG: BMP family lipoprotein [Anaerolineae bacterium]